MTVAERERPTGKRPDGTHWQSDKQECIRGHDLRPEIDGQPNPNVRRHAQTGTRQCVMCSRIRARLIVRVRTALDTWQAHANGCKSCQRGRWCEEGRIYRKRVHQRINDLSEAGFDTRTLSL